MGQSTAPPVTDSSLAISARTASYCGFVFAAAPAGAAAEQGSIQFFAFSRSWSIETAMSLLPLFAGRSARERQDQRFGGGALVIERAPLVGVERLLRGLDGIGGLRAQGPQLHAGV